MPRKRIGMCMRCKYFIIDSSESCKICGKVDNDFCRSCHKYNHRFNTALKYGLKVTDNKGLQKGVIDG